MNRQVKSNNHSPKKKALLSTAETLFWRFGFKRVTVNEICDKAGVSKMTFYKFFKNKKDLVIALLSIWIEDGLSYLDEINERDIDITEKIRLLLEYKLEAAKKMNPEFIRELLTGDSGFKTFLEETRQERYRRILAFLAEAQRKGEMSPYLRPEFIMIVLDQIFELSRDENVINLYPDFLEMTREIFDFLFYGLIGQREIIDPERGE